MKSKYLLLGLFLSLAVTVSCKKKSSDDDDDAASSTDATVNLNFLSSLIVDSELNLTTAATHRDLEIAESATADGLRSLKMYFRQIQICGGLESSGTGYSNTVGCVDLYLNGDDEYTGTEQPTATDRERFSEAGEGKFFDILDDADLAKLNQPVTVEPGEYNYGIIETHPWVKINAKSGTLCTLPTGAYEKASTGGDGIVTSATVADSVTCGAADAEETLVYITNANSTFKFLKPFTVDEGDEVTVDLAFNMDKEVKAFEDNGRSTLGTDGGAAGFYIPMIKIGAAPRLAEETTKVETYILGLSTQKEQIRVQLYYNSADDDQAILGTNATVLGTTASTVSKANKPIYTYQVEQTGDVVTFKSWDDDLVMTFTRGAAGTATVSCEGSGGGSMLEECSGLTEVQLTYEAPTTADL